MAGPRPRGRTGDVRVTAVPVRIQWAVERMTLAPGDRLLEVGCGGGHALALLGDRAPGAVCIGIDRSAHQVNLARARLARIPAARRPAVEHLTLEAAAQRWSARPFDHILAINVNVFWTNPAHAVPQLAALLTPRGHAHLVYEPPSAGRREALRTSLEALLHDHGLEVSAIEETRPDHALCIGVTAQRPVSDR